MVFGTRILFYRSAIQLSRMSPARVTKTPLSLHGKFEVSPAELCLPTVLRCGQTFRWKRSGPDEWSCGFSDRIISLTQTPTHLSWRAIFPDQNTDKPTDDTEAILRNYFNLSVDLTTLYEKWSLADPNFKKKANEFSGVRMLRQDPLECLLGFICSSNNNIARIGQMVDKFCLTYGTPLGHITHHPLNPDDPDQKPTEVAYYSFPTLSSLQSPKVESTLRTLGFGYRAKYIAQTANLLAERPSNYLETLRDEKSYAEAHAALLEFSGVGPKVADCVCLMSLDKMGAVPVDTHVWQIATRDYKFKGKGKSMTKAIYDAVGEHFRELWGEEAGWAHSVLFTADLKVFEGRLEATKKTGKGKEVVEVVVKKEIKEEETEDGVVLKEETLVEVTETGRGRKRGQNGVVKTEVKTEIKLEVEETSSRRVRSRRR